jgi:hypothetical protein
MWDTPMDDRDHGSVFDEGRRRSHSGNSNRADAVGHRTRLSHDRACALCGHPMHTYLPCSDHCACIPATMSGWTGLGAA